MLRPVDFCKYNYPANSVPHKVSSCHDTVNVPDVCPRCGYSIAPIIMPSFTIENKDKNEQHRYAILLCTHCYKAFVAHYMSDCPNPDDVAPKSLPSRSFEAQISDLSPNFIEVYNQSLVAENMGLNEIAGMGYRKAIEFLIKDFLIDRNPDDADSIRGEALGSCIHNRIIENRLRTSSSRAVWLGNDFTHYTRKYTEYDLNDMKRYIDAALHWILMELFTDEAENMDRR